MCTLPSPRAGEKQWKILLHFVVSLKKTTSNPVKPLKTGTAFHLSALPRWVAHEVSNKPLVLAAAAAALIHLLSPWNDSHFSGLQRSIFPHFTMGVLPIIPIIPYSPWVPLSTVKCPQLLIAPSEWNPNFCWKSSSSFNSLFKRHS